MDYITYKQADARWGRKNYNGSSSMATAGCGPTSVAMLAYAVDGKTTPWDVAKYMQKHGYAIRNNGTAWAGIPAAMKAFGLTDVKNVSDMEDVWRYMSKGYCAVFLFRGGSRGGVTWTTAGHYVAVTGYKVQSGKHYLYTRDSGGRNHTGWYAYETTMRGLIPQIWVGKVPNMKVKPTTPAPAPKTTTTKPTSIPTLPSRGYFKIGDSGTNVKRVQNILVYFKINIGGAGVDGVYGGGTASGVKSFQKKYDLRIDGEWGKQCNDKAKELLGIKKDNSTPVKSTPKCIDVSDHRGKIDWKKVKASGINYAIIHAGFGNNNIDSRFIENMKGAIAAGVKVGVYWFSYAYTVAMAKNEARCVIKAIQPYRSHIELGVWFDYEYDSDRYAKQKTKTKPSVSLLTEMTKAFCDTVRTAGYKAGFYYNYDFKKNRLNMDALRGYYHWYALYENEKQTNVGMQQYSSKGKVPGISGNVDMNWIINDSFMGAPKVATTKPTTTTKPVTKAVTTVSTAKTYSGTFPKLSNLAPELMTQTARELAWPYGTKTNKYKYPNGSPTAAFKKAIDRVYPHRSGWSDRPKKGASCDVFVGTVVRASGHDGSFPRGLSDVAGHVKKKPKLWKTINKPKKSELKAGDIIVWETSSAGHIFVYVGGGHEAEANHNGKKYGHISKLYIPSKPKKYTVYRPIGGRKYLIQGDTCQQVVYLQRFLNWCLDIKLKDDGGFGPKTAEAVRAFQKKYALTPDGVFGEASLAKAKVIKK